MLEIPIFDKLIANEMYNIDESRRLFKETGSINAYTLHESMGPDDALLKELNGRVK